MTDDLTFQAARTYAERGWAVFPLHGTNETGACTCGEATCGSNTGKHPRTRHGHLDATADHEQIAAWFDPERPGYLANSNIGIATGSISGLVVIDIDPRHSGEESWNECEYQAAIEEADLHTRSVITGSAGSHLYYEYPTLGTSVQSKNGFLQGVDVKADGGYVCAPPSLHLSGRTYAWRDTSTPIAPLPLFLYNLILNSTGTATGGALVHDADLGAILRGEERVRLGQRDNVFFALACRLRGRNATMDEAGETLARIWEQQTDQDPSDLYPLEKVMEKLVRAYEKFEPNAAPEIGTGQQAWVDLFNKDESSGDDPPDRVSLPPGGLWDGYDGAQDTHRANGRRISFRFQGQVRCFQYSRDTTWYRCQEGLWVHDHNAARMCAANYLEPMIRREAEQASSDDESDRLAKWAHMSASAGAPRAAAEYAADDPLVSVRGTSAGQYFDPNPDQIAFPNGVVNLQTGEFRSLTPEDHISRTCAIPYDGRLVDQCPRWFAFLNLVLPDPEVREYVRLMLGMSLLGADKNHEFFVLDGSGANGKSTALAVVTQVLGRYALPVPKSVFVQRRDDAHPADTATLEGLRFATNGTELKAGDTLNEDLLKSLVSLEPFPTRKMHEDFWTLTPRCTLWLSTNELPKIRDTSVAMRRRLRRIRFEVTIPPPYDPLFAQKIVEAEGPAILATLVADCRRYLDKRASMVQPMAVVVDTEEYLEEEDPFAVFVKDCLEASSDSDTDTDWVPVPDLYQIYQDWCTVNGTSARGKAAFGRSVTKYFPRGRRYVQNRGQLRVARCRVVYWPHPEALDLVPGS